jgi:hypothetical protein
MDEIVYADSQLRSLNCFVINSLAAARVGAQQLDEKQEPLRDLWARCVECLQAFQLDFVSTNWVKFRGDRACSSEWLRDGKWKPFQRHLQGEWLLLSPAQIRKISLERCPAPTSALLTQRWTNSRPQTFLVRCRKSSSLSCGDPIGYCSIDAMFFDTLRGARVISVPG